MKRCTVGAQRAGAGPEVRGFQLAMWRKRDRVGVCTVHCDLGKNRVRTQHGVCLGHTPRAERWNAVGRVHSGCTPGAHQVHSEIRRRGQMFGKHGAPAQFTEFIAHARACEVGAASQAHGHLWPACVALEFDALALVSLSPARASEIGPCRPESSDVDHQQSGCNPRQCSLSGKRPPVNTVKSTDLAAR